MPLRDSSTLVRFASLGGRRRHTDCLALIAVLLALSGTACVMRESEITIDNRTTKDILLVNGDSGGRYLIPACGRIVINQSDGAKSLDRSASPPLDSVVVRYNLPSLPDAPVVASLTITSEAIWTGVLATPPPCVGDPPSPGWGLPDQAIGDEVTLPDAD